MINSIVKNVSKKFLNSLPEEGLNEFKKIHEEYVKDWRFTCVTLDLERLTWVIMYDIYDVLHDDSKSMMKTLWYKFKNYALFFRAILDDNIADFMLKYMSDELKEEISK